MYHKNSAFVFVSVVRTTVTSSSTLDDDVELPGSVKHVRTYQVFRGMSPDAANRLEVITGH